MQVWSQGSLSGLRILHCCKLWHRPMMQLRSSVYVAMIEAGTCSSDLTPSLETSIGHRSSLKKKKCSLDYITLQLWPSLSSPILSQIFWKNFLCLQQCHFNSHKVISQLHKVNFCQSHQNPQDTFIIYPTWPLSTNAKCWPLVPSPNTVYMLLRYFPPVFILSCLLGHNFQCPWPLSSTNPTAPKWTLLSILPMSVSSTTLYSSNTCLHSPWDLLTPHPSNQSNTRLT